MTGHAQCESRLLLGAVSPRFFVAAFVVLGACPVAAQIFPQDADRRWEPEPAQTYTVALGDVDGDGDLDLVSGNFGESNRLYLHDGSVLSETPAWPSEQARSTQAIALGDVDRDGDLDLVCGNGESTGGQPNTLYLNEGGASVFSLTEAPWQAEEAVTQAVALGDMDGDGALDLVCGNDGHNRVYLNTGDPDTVFARTPAWSDSLASNTQAVALGDVDGDGDLDLVCGNTTYNTLYLNEGGTLSRTPVWSEAVASNTRGVALGDVNGDGRIDLVCGNAQNNTVYLNTGVPDSLFSSTPIWSDTLANTTSAVALGDVDGDGRLDLVCGNENQANTLYLNTGLPDSPFAPTPDWSSSATNTTASVALGDVDADGDLDLVCGNLGQSSTLYLNMRRSNGDGVISRDPSWASSFEYNTQAVALGDVDADGNLDLVCVNSDTTYQQPSTLYFNDGGRLFPSPAWSPIGRMRAVALGDLNGDGHLDLACGNGGGIERDRATVYLGDGAVLSSRPAWSAAQFDKTWAVAVGDVDGDGSLDLVCGNERANTVYLNRSAELIDLRGDASAAEGPTTFHLRLSWSSAPPDRSTRAVALGDVDGDGDLDLVCGNDGAPTNRKNTLYRNDGGTLSPEPTWSSSIQSPTQAVALGDVDGDGDLDLVCGNFGSANTLYLNEGGTFSAMPYWASPAPHRQTTAVALGDLDGDGDLDLLCGNFEGPNTVYLNDGAGFSRTRGPDWVESGASGTQAVALGDLDRDGDLDVVFGNGSRYAEPGTEPGEANTVYSGLRCPAYKGDPLAPTNQLPNNGAYLVGARHEVADPDHLLLRFRSVDVESDPVCVVAEFQHEGAALWSPVELIGTDGALSSSPLGVEHAVEWDISRLPFDVRPVVVRLRAISNPTKAGLIRYVSSYSLPVGRITPSRPEIRASVSTIAFPTVTVGDTVAVHFTLANAGTQNLHVREIATDPEIQEIRLVAPELPVIIPPGQAEAVEMEFAPRKLVDVTGHEVVVASNDSLRSSLSLPLTVDVLELAITSRLVGFPGDSPLPLAQAVTALVTPAEEGVLADSGFVHHRPVGGAAYDSVALFRFEDLGWSAVIPGGGVTEAGLEYYVSMVNGEIRAYDGTRDDPHRRDVEPPDAISNVTARPTAGSDYVAGREIEIQVTLPGGAIFDSGAVHYRQGGEGEARYRAVSLSAGDVLSASIPADVVGGRGVEYWVEVWTPRSPRPLTVPREDPMLVPRTIAVTVARLQESQPQVGERYRILSLPLDFSSSSETIAALLSDQPEFGPYDPLRWEVWRWVPGERGYVGLSDATAREQLRPEPGRAFWLISRATHRVDTAPVTGRSTPTDRPYEIELGPEWTMFGNPFAFPVSWSSVRVGDVPASEYFEPSDGPIRWIALRGDYDRDETASRLEPFDGYWVYNAGGKTVLRIPPIAAEAAAARASLVTAPDAAGRRAPVAGWRVALDAESGSGARAEVVLGTDPEARDEYDRLDRLAPPPAPGPWVRLGVDHRDWAARPGDYRQDLRAPDPEGHRFDLSLRGADVEEIRLAASAEPDLAPSIQLRLIDLEQGLSIDPRTDEGLHLLSFGPDRPYRLSLLAGTEEFVSRGTEALVSGPATLVLDQNAPNPFGSATRVRFGLPRPGPVTLEIFDVRGALVASLVNDLQPAGYHTVIWDGRDGRGRRAATGVYFYRVTTADGVLTRKMARLR